MTKIYQAVRPAVVQEALDEFNYAAVRREYFGETDEEIAESYKRYRADFPKRFQGG